MARFLLILFFAFLGFVIPVTAEDKTEKEIIEELVEEEKDYSEENQEPVRYAPDHCDFEITFPGEPEAMKRCPEGADECYDLTSYTMVYDLSTTVETSVTCIPSTAANYARYNERVIRAALNGMVARAQIEDFNINTREVDDTRQGSLIGSGTYGKQSRIYNAQLWIGKNSVMTVEAKLTGNVHGEADETFSKIISSIKKKRPEGETAPKKEDSEKEEKPED